MSQRPASGRSGQRCPVCGNWGWLMTAAGHDECTHCRLIVHPTADLRAVAADIARRLAGGIVDLRRDPAPEWTIDPAGLRNVAWRFGHVVAPLPGERHRFPPDGTPARAVVRRAEALPHAITLGMMTRAAEIDSTAALLGEIGDAFAAVVVVVDGSDAAAAALCTAVPRAMVAAHPLDGDFAAQRNRVQEMAGAGWVLQLDADERPDATLLDSFGWLVAAAGRDGLRSLGLARRNLVDGVRSALFPDIQYRLNHAAIRFAGAVHERPVTVFSETSLALAGAIEHRLDGARVRERTRLYEAMSSGAGRPEDEDLLLRPFDPIAVR